jgi:hypothetical protein
MPPILGVLLCFVLGAHLRATRFKEILAKSGFALPNLSPYRLRRFVARRSGAQASLFVPDA